MAKKKTTKNIKTVKHMADGTVYERQVDLDTGKIVKEDKRLEAKLKKADK